MTVDFDGIGADDQALLDGLRTFVQKEVVPLEEEHRVLLEDPRRLYDDRGAYAPAVLDLMRQVRTASSRAGYYTMFCPEELGGGGLGAVMSFLAWELLHHEFGAGRLLVSQAVSHWSSGPSFLLGALSDRLRNEVAPAIMAGETTVCFAMSEPDAGSDAWAMSTTARRDRDGWVLNGTKQWISSSPFADYAIVFAVTDEELRRARKGGITCFLVPTQATGFSVDSIIKLFGQVGGNEAILSFSDVWVPDDHVVGGLHDGFSLAVGGVSLGRMYNAGRCVGLARWALEQATGYVQERKAFGRPISEYQGVSFQLAESAMEIYAARTMTLDCAHRLDAGERADRNVNMVKAYVTEMCFRVLDRCMQVHGAMGMTNEMRLYEGWHTARTVRMADGSAEVMRRNIARALLRGDTGF